MKTVVLPYILTSLVSINTEHQIRLCDDNKTVLEKLHLNAIQEKKSSVYYLETTAHDLAQLGVSVRVRVKNNSTEITVKKRFGGSKVQLKSAGEIICENDLHGGVKELSCKINATVDKSEFEKVRVGKKNWLQIVSSAQLEFLKKYNADILNIVIFGTLTDHRYQWNDKIFGEITVDLVEQKNKEEIKYNEISIRYDESDLQMGKRFEDYFKSTGIKACDNQQDWPINKFDTLEILN